ncbi:hypothetical protein AB0I55_18105 [Actinocatenispora sera]|uniref:hypothetical protein n=1 Tax=Actinocatenispora sera TaxID=390989 RepID=UPI0033C650EE
MTGNRDDAIKAMASDDWSGAQVERAPRRVSTVFSVRLPAELADWLAGEADHRHGTPSTVLRDLVAAAARTAHSDSTVTLRLSDLHRAIDALAHPAA